MQDLRPMPLMLLKKRFLKVLCAELTKGKTLDYQPIFLSAIPKFFSIPPLSNKEFQVCEIAVQELARDHYIKKIPNEKYKYTLTPLGYKVATKDIDEMKLPHLDRFELLIQRYDLMIKVSTDCTTGDFESAVFKAFKLLEERVRVKTNQSQAVIGVTLMDNAFKPEGGLLKHPRALTKAEQKGIHFMMRGAISFFKNPSSHRTVDWDDPNKLADVLGFAKFLLDLVDECELV